MVLKIFRVIILIEIRGGTDLHNKTRNCYVSGPEVIRSTVSEYKFLLEHEKSVIDLERTVYPLRSTISYRYSVKFILQNLLVIFFTDFSNRPYCFYL